MNVEVITNSLFESTTNLLIPENPSNKDSWIVDCGDTNKIIEKLVAQGLALKGILLTHAHFDHIYGINSLLKFYNECVVYTNEIGKEMLQDPRKNMSHYYGTSITTSYPDNIEVIRDGDEIKICKGFKAKAIFTPGHNPSCITWLIDEAIFTGDSYIPGIKTVTNLPGGNKQQAKQSEDLILHLAANRTIYPGHILPPPSAPDN